MESCLLKMEFSECLGVLAAVGLACFLLYDAKLLLLSKCLFFHSSLLKLVLGYCYRHHDHHCRHRHDHHVWLDEFTHGPFYR